MKMEKERQSVEIELLGQKLTVKTESDPRTVKEVVELVQGRLKHAQERTRGAAPHQLALLALLDLAEDYVSAKYKVAEHRKKINEKSSELFNLIDSELK
jgi:cell division protein ZapA (FtsZ GTPase activity inhibitor)